MRCLHASSTGGGWCKPAGHSTVQMCAVTPCNRLSFGEHVPVCLLFHSEQQSLKASSCVWSQHHCEWPLNSFSCFIYRHGVAGCIALLSAIIAPVSPHSPLKSQPIATTQTKTNIETHTQTHTGISQYIYTHSTSTRGQRMNNAEVVSEWKSPPLFPSFSPSLSNKEAMLPWRQWSLGTLSANCSLPCVKHRTNGCSSWCCCCHRHWNPIGWALLFDWISDLVFERKNISRSATCVPTYEMCLFSFFHEMKRITLWEVKCFCFKGLRHINSVPFFGSVIK